MDPTPVIAIIDIGKTNKKLFLFDHLYRIVWQRTEQFPETVDDDGDPCEDLHRLSEWVLIAVQEVSTFSQFALQAINFSTYGASLVYLNAKGDPIGHLYSYLKPLPAYLRQQFYEQYGPAERLSLQTGSPLLDSLNAGVMLFRIKYDKPQLYRLIKHVLHLPQYLSYLITGQLLSELTSIGCHTMLWDFTHYSYHDWVVSEGFNQLMGSLFPADKALNAITVKGGVSVGVGLHDSSAALIPYLASFTEPFVLISTGTWCISMNPFNLQPLTDDELHSDCLTFMSYKGQPVKASRLFAGYEHEQQTKRLAEHFDVAVDYYQQVSYDDRIIKQLSQTSHSKMSRKSQGKFITVGVANSISMSAFSGRNLFLFANYEIAYHQLIMDLMAGQVISTSLVVNHTSITRIFVDGGFSQNPIYMNLLAAAFPMVEVWATALAQATALGAALAFHDQWNPLPIPQHLISLTRYEASCQEPTQVNAFKET